MIPGLLITEGPKKGTYIQLKEKEPFWIGRSLRANFTIEGDTTVSNKHCQFLLTGSKLCMKDESRNGTRLNSRKIQNAWVILKIADTVRIGGTTHFQVVDVDASGETEEFFDINACLDDVKQRESFPEDRRALKNLGPYEILDLIGSGSFGAVYRSFSKELNRSIALKVFTRREEPTNKFMGRFLREAELLKKLSNPFLIHLYDAGEVEQDGVVYNYMAIEYFAGVNLTHHLTAHNGKISWSRVLKILIQTSEALQHMHENGVIHRDLKPDNILYDHIKNVAKIIDLGLGKCITDEERTTFCVTKTGSGLGTPNYMPIEQWKEAKNVNATADIYSLGATAYYLLTGTPPYFKYDDYLELLQAINEHKIIPLETVCPPEVPEELVRLVKKMMSYESKKRHSNARHLLDELYALAQQYGVSVDDIEKRLIKYQNHLLKGMLTMPPPSSGSF